MNAIDRDHFSKKHEAPNVKKLGSATDPLWYKDAIIYELHVRAFCCSNNDGIGDFQGLISKLDYLQELGVTCLWLLPFFPSPLRDDGYDIANYVDVNPSYGTLADFQQFLDEAHKRSMQVMIELVINHTSDQHPWFKAARIAAPGSPEREMYVWSQTDQLYKDARIIFTDTEKSNWTWDETAQSYYWHRFFSHQPDLNFDNPRVIEEVISAMRFWLDMGVDALRMDAIPYLIERDHTTCENLPETHVAIKLIRAAIDADYANRLILAEANQWPTDVRPYFGDGDECHMAFHFPLMPRIYMALRQEDRLPITDIMAQTPPIPDICQWGLFLRNHDELTLEMVTDDERDYMYLAYSADPRMRINVGIRRRLAPLVDNNRRRIELLNSLLLSFPGTPIMYYGDEIGMGDNIYLGDRNGVRTPMQWNSDRNAGFSKCDPARLYFPVVMDPIYGYQSSLLHWTRNMIALRKLFQVFGRGTLEFLHPENRKILAYLRNLKRDDGSMETVLCVANLSRFAQPVSLDLKPYTGSVPVEMLGYVTFPAITEAPYPLTVAPYSFLWFELQPAGLAPIEEPMQLELAADVPTIDIHASGWNSLATPQGRELLESALSSWLPHQRWFGAKSRTIQSVSVNEYALFPSADDQSAGDPASFGSAIFFLTVNYTDGAPDTYQVPLALGDAANLESLTAAYPQSLVATLTTPSGPVLLHDATVREDFRNALLKLIEGDTSILLAQTSAKLTGSHSTLLQPGAVALASSVHTGEQSNTSIFFGDKMILKLFRKLQPGENPDIEIGRFLTEVAHFPRIASFLGEITLLQSDGQKTSSAILQELVKNEGDGWSWTLSELARFYESVAGCPPPHEEGQPPTFLHQPPVSQELRDRDGLYLAAAALLGRRTAELHLALATPTNNPAFQSEPILQADLEADATSIQNQLVSAIEALRYRIAVLDSDSGDDAATLLTRRADLEAVAQSLATSKPSGHRIRIHGDFHLGQILRAKNDFVLLDFEGEPARPLHERRRKQSPLKDVAGMLRSFSYAAGSALNTYAERYPHQRHSLEPWARLWENSVASEFLRAYIETASANRDLLPEPAQADLVLRAYLIDKALYELLYELDNRPGWVRIPLSGLLALTSSTSTELS